MKHSVSKRKDFTILKIEETVFDVRHSRTFSQSIDSILQNQGKKNMIIDFSLVKAIDSCGISCMLLAHQKANQSEGLAIFVSLCQQIKDLLKLSGLDKQLYIFTSLNEVMTLIEASGKSKKGSKKRFSSKTPVLPDGDPQSDIELIAASDFKDDNIIEETGNNEEHASKQTKPQKKRGRTKKPSPPPAPASRTKK